MKLRNYLKGFYAVGLCVVIYSCSSDERLEEETFTPQTYNVGGKVEKGPFVSGSTITVQPMNAKMQALGEMYSSTIQDNVGNFSFGSKMFESPYAELTASGYFFNEVSGSLSSGTLNLRAVVDLSDESTVNVNILTHLKYQRVLNLIDAGNSFKEANEQAQQELFSAFGLQRYAETDASRFSIIGGNDESAALIAISSLLLVDRKEAGITEFLATLCHEFARDGSFSETTKQKISEDKMQLSSHLSKIKLNIISRYDDLGLSVEVKELAYFFDWDDDGIAGNEILKEGEEVIIEKTDLKAPNEGGVYEIRITSPIPIFLDLKHIDKPILEDIYYSSLYDETVSQNISIEKSLEGNVLTLKVDQLNSRATASLNINLYDCLGHVIGAITLTQEGNRNAAIPKLGKDGKSWVSNLASKLGHVVSDYNIIEQYYYYNTMQTNLVNQYVHPGSSHISSVWGGFYQFVRNNLTLKKFDSEQLGVYQDYCTIFNALSYYYMVAGWGDVPYIIDYDWYQNFESSIPRTDEAAILNDLKENLEVSIAYLDEKKNESLSDIDNFFFVSKDVARILLANIYMYQNDYTNAKDVLEKVISNGFYSLDASNFSEKKTIEDINNNGGGKEIIFALKNDVSTGSGNTTVSPVSLIPVFTYSDVMLSCAECLYKTGNAIKAKAYLDTVISAKGITVSADGITGITDARRQLFLYCVGNLAFMKRNNIAKSEYNIQDYQTLFPIPFNELALNSQMTQNPGY